MNIQEVLKLKNGTIVQNEITKKRYVIYDYFFGLNKYLIKYENRNDFEYTMKPEELKEITVSINDILILAEYTVCPNFKERDNFIYEGEDGELYKGMILKVNDYSYEVVIVMKDKIEQIIITNTDMWRMRKIV